jgi:DNA polymerase-3 subunit alpha
VGALREINTKNGNRMGFATLEDIGGSIELTLFPETFRQSATHLRSGVPLLVRGKLEGGASTRKLLAEEVRPLPTGPPLEVLEGPRAAQGCRIRLAAGPSATDRLAAIRALCDAHPGTVPVSLHVELPASEVIVRSRTIRVLPSTAFLSAVENLLGIRSVTLAE